MRQVNELDQYIYLHNRNKDAKITLKSKTDQVTVPPSWVWHDSTAECVEGTNGYFAHVKEGEREGEELCHWLHTDVIGFEWTDLFPGGESANLHGSITIHLDLENLKSRL